jgi:transcriptional regulator with XRE-family HTH domain
MARKPRSAAQKKIDLQIGKRLAELRKEHGFTQAELAASMGIVQVLISDYETGKLRLHPEMLIKFAHTFEVSADELLGLKPPKKAGPSNQRLWRRFRQLDKLPAKERKQLLAVIDTFLERDKLQKTG